MANQEQLDRLLKQDVQAWNEWRRENPDVQVDLRGANLSGATLNGADLRGAAFNGANLISAVLFGATFVAPP
jgi:uncharacterized protein YjbI with pentapeptide repeats